MGRSIRISLLVLGLATCVFGFTLGVRAEEEPAFFIDRFTFIWTVERVGEASLRVEKTQDTITVDIVSGAFGSDYLSMKPAEAEAVGTVLADTRKYWEEMRGASEDVDKRVTAGKHIVTFRHSTKVGFYVTVRPDQQFSISSISLDRDEAMKFAPHLKRATQMAAFVDQKIRP